MKVELQCGDSITIPEGCKAIVKDGCVVFEKEEKKEKNFKDGDVLHSKTDDTMLIFKEVCNHDREAFDSHYNTSRRDDKRWNINAFRLATEEEKQLLFDKMKEKRLLWNAEKKCVELNRWKAKEGEIVYFLNLHQDESIVSKGIPASVDYLWETYNYFRTKEQTEEAARRVKGTLFRYHEEIGE